MSRSSHLDSLVAVPLFSSLSRKELQKVMRASVEITVSAGRPLMEQGAYGKEMFVLLEGRATVRRNGRKVSTFEPGAAIGELALLDRGVRTATVTTDTDCRVLVLGSREFSALLHEVPAIAIKLLATLAGRIRDLDSKAYG